MYLTETATVHVRMTLSTRILAVPLRKLEELGAARVNAILINDLGAVVGSMSLIPLLSLNITIVLGSLAFMGFLSWQMLVGVLVFLIIGVVAYNVPLRRGYSHIRALREKGNELLRHLRSLTEGIKELKLHHERRRAFLDQELRATSVGLRRARSRARSSSAAATSPGLSPWRRERRSDRLPPGGAGCRGEPAGRSGRGGLRLLPMLVTFCTRRE